MRQWQNTALLSIGLSVLCMVVWWLLLPSVERAGGERIAKAALLALDVATFLYLVGRIGLFFHPRSFLPRIAQIIRFLRISNHR